MVYSDGTHLVADTLDELHAFAARIGRKRCWFDACSKYPVHMKHPHYDLHGRGHPMYSHDHYWARRVLEFGAIKVWPREQCKIANRCAYYEHLKKGLTLKIKLP